MLSLADHKVIILALLRDGLPYTLRLAALALVLSMAIGLVLGIVRSLRIPIVDQILALYSQISRGVPGIVIVFFMYTTLRMHDTFTTALIALTFISAPKIMEIVKNGLFSVNKGQWEAARSLALPMPVTLIKIVIPQVVLITLPGIIGQLILIVKGTPLVSLIGGVELARRAQYLLVLYGHAFFIYGYVLIIYFILCRCLTVLSNKIEKSLVRRIIGENYAK